MSHCLSRSPAVPVFRESPSASALWIVAECGTILSASGAGWARIEQDPADLIGRSLWEWAGERADVRDIVARVLAGGSYHGTIEWRGVLWRIECAPLVHPVFGVTGCSCMAHAVEAAEPPTIPNLKATQERLVFAAAGDDSAYGVESDDRFVLRPDQTGVVLVRRWADSVWREYVAADPSRVHPVTPRPPASDPHVRHLRLM